jgi:lipid-binding SYLF domain-containing protein
MRCLLALFSALFLAALAAAPVPAQTLRDRLEGGAAMLRDGAGRVIDNVDRSVEGSIDLLTDEATPQETRAELDRMAFATLERLLAEQQASRDLFDRSAGYAVFDTRRVAALGLAAGVGRGVAVSLATGERIYMNMGTGGVGFSLGFGGFETQVVMLFQSDRVFDEFVTRGFDATAEAGSMFGEGEARTTARFSDGRSIFYLTNQGWKVSASAAGTRYWVDVDLN